MGKQKKNKQIILQRIRMRAALRVKRRNAHSTSKSNKLKALRITNNKDRYIRAPRGCPAPQASYRGCSRTFKGYRL